MPQPGLKLLIAGTPKTGNTWLRFLLSGVYRLPMPDLPETFREEEFARLPPAWVAQQHLRPEPELLAWGDRERAVFLTTVRHPGDALVSLWHYVRKNADDPRWTGRAPARLRLDLERAGANVASYVEDVSATDSFADYLRLSAGWAATGRSIVVRYEDLCRDAEGELARVVREIHRRREDAPLPLDRVGGAVASCQLGVLRDGLGLDPQFFRKGGSGGWVDELPPEVLEMFRRLPPYPELFAALGYSPDPRAAERLAPSSAPENPFLHAASFEDGTPLAPFLVRLFLGLDAATRARLRPLAGAADEASYQAWLAAPADDDPRPGALPRVTNLAAAIHAVRTDLQRAFPEPFGAARAEFAAWFRANAGGEYALDARLVAGERGDSGARSLCADGLYGHPWHRAILDWFDPAGYLEANPDLHQLLDRPYDWEALRYHFVNTGFYERRVYAPQLLRCFCADYYRRFVPDALKGAPDDRLMQHWLYEGIFRGYAASEATDAALSSPFQVFNMGRVASYAVVDALERCGATNVIHTHSGYEFSRAFAGSCLTFFQLLALKSRLPNRPPVFLLSGVREPVSWLRSVVARIVETGFDPGGADLGLLASQLRGRVKFMLAFFEAPAFREFHVFGTDFPADAGLRLYEAGRNRLVVYRVDKLESGRTLLADAVGFPELSIARVNQSAKPVPAELQELLRGIWHDATFAESVLASAYVRRFFSESERERIRERMSA